MQKTIYVMAFAAILTNANAASFDCSKALSLHEKTICDNSLLSAVDEKLSDYYKKLYRESPDPVRLKIEQIEWIKEVRKCQSDSTCIGELYNLRIEQLKAHLMHSRSEISAIPPSADLSVVDKTSSPTQVIPTAPEAQPVFQDKVSTASLPTAVISVSKEEVKFNLNIFSDPTYQLYGLIAGVVLVGLFFVYLIIKNLISFSKNSDAKSTVAARSGSFSIPLENQDFKSTNRTSPELDNSASKKQQIKFLLDNQNINPQPIVGMIALIVGLLGIASALSSGSKHFLLGVVMNVWLVMAAVYCFKGNLLKAVQSTQFVVCFQILSTVFGFILIKLYNNDEIMELVIFSIINLAIIIGIHIYLKGKMDRKDLTYANKLRLIWL